MDSNGSNQDDARLREEANRLLRSHPGVPNNFEATFAVKADAEAVENAREALHLNAGDKACLALMSPLLLPFLLLGMGCAVRKAHKLLTGLTDGAKNDTYVFGKEGFATINNGTVKAWTPSTGMALYPNMTMFYQSSSGPCGTSMKRQTVLVLQRNPAMGESVSTKCFESHDVSRFRTGNYQQVWFVGENDLLTLPARANMTAIGSLQGGMSGLLFNGMGSAGPQGKRPAKIQMGGSQTFSAQQQAQLAQMAATMQQQGIMTFQTSTAQY